MVALIGYMIGCYIFTMMLRLALDKDTHTTVAIFSVITMIVVFISLFMIFVSDMSMLGMPNIPGQQP